MKKYLFLMLILLALVSQVSGQSSPVRIRMPDSTYSAVLVGVAGTRTAGDSVTGTWSTYYRMHEFSGVSATGRYKLYVDAAGGTTYTLVSTWGGTYGKVVAGYDLYQWMERLNANEEVLSIGLGDTSVSSAKIKNGTIATVDLADSIVSLAKMTTAALNYIGSGGIVTNNPGGSDTQVQFNDGGSFGGDADLTWDKTNNRFGIGEASPDVSLEVTANAPYLSLHNSTEENGAGGRESRIYFKGEKFGGSEHTLAYIEVYHNTANDDTKGGFLLYLNDGSSEQQRLFILDDGEARLTGELVINYNGVGGTSGSALDVNHQTMPYIWITNLDYEDTDEGRETRICFRGTGTGTQYDDALAIIEANHDGSSGDQKGNLILKTNDGNDNDSATERMRIDSNGLHTITGTLTTSTSNVTLAKIDTVKTGGGVVRWFKITAGGSTFWCPADTSIVK